MVLDGLDILTLQPSSGIFLVGVSTLLGRVLTIRGGGHHA